MCSYTDAHAWCEMAANPVDCDAEECAALSNTGSGYEAFRQLAADAHMTCRSTGSFRRKSGTPLPRSAFHNAVRSKESKDDFMSTNAT